MSANPARSDVLVVKQKVADKRSGNSECDERLCARRDEMHQLLDGEAGAWARCCGAPICAGVGS